MLCAAHAPSGEPAKPTESKDHGKVEILGAPVQSSHLCVRVLSASQSASTQSLRRYDGLVWIHGLELDWVRLRSSNPKVSKHGGLD